MTNWQVETRKLKSVTWFRQLRYQRPLCRKHLWERATPGFVPGKQIKMNKLLLSFLVISVVLAVCCALRERREVRQDSNRQKRSIRDMVRREARRLDLSRREFARRDLTRRELFRRDLSRRDLTRQGNGWCYFSDRRRNL